MITTKYLNECGLHKKLCFPMSVHGRFVGPQLLLQRPSRLQGRASKPTEFLMTLSVIVTLLLLTPALKNNIYPVAHHHTVYEYVCYVSSCLCSGV